jgi:hypothetical protein
VSVPNVSILGVDLAPLQVDDRGMLISFQSLIGTQGRAKMFSARRWLTQPLFYISTIGVPGTYRYGI